MSIFHGISGLQSLQPGSILSIGNYDGLHLGHRALIERMKQLRSDSAKRLVVVTFEPHPLTVLKPAIAPPRLTQFAQKVTLLEQAGIDDIVVLPPSRDVLDLTAEEFWQILRDQTRPSHIVEGMSFNFGRARTGSIEKLIEWSRGSGVSVHRLENVEVVLTDMTVVECSSSIVRWLLIHGRARDAALMLARPYSLTGKVVEGFRRGRTLQVPTANLAATEQLVPLDGVYAGRCRIDAQVYPSAISIGTSPTFSENKRQIEAHLIGFDGDLYGRTIEVEIVDWLRDQRRYGTIDALKSQIAIDIEASRRIGLRDYRAGFATV